MHLVEQHVINKPDPRFASIDRAAFASKNLYNAALYEQRQAFIFRGEYIGYEQLYHRMKGHEAYQALPRKVSQQVLKQVDKAWKSYFAACAAWEEDPSKFLGHPKLPKYKDKQQEVDRVLQGRTPTSADLVKLPYSLQVFKETMRLYPPAYMVLREAIRDVEIEGYLVPKGDHVMLAVYTMQRNPEYFPDPDRFDPDRFTPENEKRLPRYAYIPFGGGPRICLGNHFALMEGHLIIRENPSKNLTLRPDGKLLMKVSQR
jgi:hypothetical protein